MTSCLERDTLERFVAGTAGRRECREIVCHLLAGCGACAAVLRSAYRPPVEEGDYEAALARWIELVPAQAGCP